MTSPPTSRWLLFGAAAVAFSGVGCGAEEQEKAVQDDVLEPAPDLVPATPRLRRLTQVQYQNSVADLFGDDLVLPVSLEPDVREEGLQSVGAGSTSVSPRGVEQYEDAAYDIAEQVTAYPSRLAEWMSCEVDAGYDAACTDELLSSLGRRAWRRPLESDEVDTLRSVVELVATESGDFGTGLTYGIAAILMDARFIYRVELGEDDGAGGRALNDLELATRLSYFLWNTLPDEELLAAAEAGELSTDAGLLAQAERLLSSDRARDGVETFFTELYQLDLLDDITKDPLVIPQASPEVGPAARAETLAVIDRLVFDEDADFRDVLTTRTTWVDRRLAAIYGIQAPSIEGAGWVELPVDGGRRGVLGQTSFLMLNAHNSTTSATLRGKFVRERMLCQVMPAPPANVDTSIPEADETSPTLRDRIAVHLEDPTCAGCHELMDPIGLGFENFDAIGRWRDTERGAQIDASGVIDGETFTDAWQMSEAIASHPQFGPCLAENLYQYALGHVAEEGEEALVEWLGEAFVHDGYQVDDLIVRIIQSPAFRQVGDIQ